MKGSYMRRIRIGKKFIGENEPCFIIAEAGANHDSMVERGKKLVEKAVESGVDAIKFQTYTADKLTTKAAPKYWKDDKPNETQYEVFQKLDKLTEGEWKELINYCKKLGIIFLSTPFDEESSDFLEDLGIPAFKIASADITHLPLLKHVAEKRLPMIISTGMADLDEIKEAVKTIKSSGNEDIILLHCVISYPAEIGDVNLRIIRTLQKAFPDIPIGFSDHTIGTIIPLVAVSLGAKVIEKHFTIDKKLSGSPDHRLSVNPEELREMTQKIRIVEKALGSPIKRLIESEKEGIKFARRSVVSNVSITKGTKISRSMLSVKRPGTGIPPKYIDKVVGKVAKRNIDKDEVLNWHDLE
jgi:N-acetylneuraminate synthase/N,N'-diacetyllegionaminate synthase